MPRIEIDINDSTLRAKLAQLKQEGREPGPALTEIGAELKKRIQLGFRTGRSPDGHPWVPIKHRQGSPLLASGRLRSSIDYHVAGDSVTIGTNLVYAALHQFGGEVRPKNKKALISSSYVQITSVDYEDKDKACALKLGLKFLHSDAGNDDLILLAK